jgi:hemoglobin
VLADPLLKPLCGAGRPEHVDHLTAFEAESFGGPDDFTRQLGFRHLIDLHRGLEISKEQRQRFVELYCNLRPPPWPGWLTMRRSATPFAHT